MIVIKEQTIEWDRKKKAIKHYHHASVLAFFFIRFFDERFHERLLERTSGLSRRIRFAQKEIGVGKALQIPQANPHVPSDGL